MGTLYIRHVADSAPPRFFLERPGGKSTPPVEIAPPARLPAARSSGERADGTADDKGEDKRDTPLSSELRWYLEDFLDYPFEPATERADRVQEALRTWGEQTFEALFGDRAGGRELDRAMEGGPEALALQVWSDDARVLAWPWEALRDREGGFVAQTATIERRLNRVPEPPMPAVGLPADRVNILLVIARPLAGDIRYRSISRSLVELIEKKHLRAYVHVLRPPTFDELRRHLEERPAYYHLVHFDGHGSFGAAPPPAGTGPHAYTAREGALLFEDAQGKEDPIRAEVLSALLQKHRVPAMVLNACRSAMLNEDDADPFASVAASLLRAGTRAVVAMSYSLYVSGAQQFLPAFYGRLFQSGSFGDAVRAGRQQMFREPGRVCARGRFALQDWVVPVLYQQEGEAFSFWVAGDSPASRRSRLSGEAVDSDNPHGMIGRDGAILEIERALRRAPPAVLVHGLGGVGKTTLVRGLLSWLEATEGLGEGCLWFSFQGIHSAEYVLNQLGEMLFGPDFGAAKMEPKIEALAREMKKHPAILVWDNFEDAAGYGESEANLSDQDRGYLKAFLKGLRGGKTKVIITSRSEETWLGQEQRYKVELPGLDEEERWTYAEAILGDLGVEIDRNDKDLAELMKLLGGHPLSMRVILPRMEAGSGHRTAGQLVTTLRTNLRALKVGEGDETLDRLYATLQLAEEVVPEDLRELLVPLGMHERFVDGDYLADMATNVDAGWTRERIDRFLQILARAGLLRDIGQAIHEMHPALTGFLRSRVVVSAPVDLRDRWSHGFVDVMGTVADAATPRKLHEQRFTFHVHAESFQHALREAERLGKTADQAALTQALAAYALNTRRFAEARALYQRLADGYGNAGDEAGQVLTYHQLGRVAQEQREFAAAEAWYKKSLAIWEKQGNEHGAALTYHQLGRVAEEQREFAAAEAWYKKSLAISEKQGNEHGAALTYHQLGMVAEEQREFAAAEAWYKKSLAISERLGIDHFATSTYHQLGIVAQKRREFAAAEAWYKKALAIEEKQGNEHVAAQTYHQLGMVAEEQREFAAAEAWYKKSLAISERLGIDHFATSTYHQLGIVAEEQREFAAAEAWYKKSLAIKEKQGNEHGAASTYGQLGNLARLQGRIEDAARWYIRATLSFVRCNDPWAAQQVVGNFRLLLSAAPPALQPTLESLWRDAGLPTQE